MISPRLTPYGAAVVKVHPDTFESMSKDGQILIYLMQGFPVFPDPTKEPGMICFENEAAQ